MFDVFVSGTQLHQFGGLLHWNRLTEINDCTAIPDLCAVRNKINVPGIMSKMTAASKQVEGTL